MALLEYWYKFEIYFYYKNLKETMTPDPSIYQRPAELLQHLIRFDTTNPPGSEIECITYLNDLLHTAGFNTQILSKEPSRANLITTIKGRGEAPPLLLYGHVDVVTTANQEWEHDPFGGEIIDGTIWGRGALDMKAGVAMMVAALLRMKAEGVTPPGDVILGCLSDEEAGGVFGAKFLVEEHPEIFKEVRYALGEIGGFNLEILGKKFYPIQIAEKQTCQMRIIVRGSAGHGSMVIRGGTMAKLGNVLKKLDQNLLPVHITPTAREMFEQMASKFTFPINLILRLLLNPRFTDLIFKVMGDKSGLFLPIFHNTVNATIVKGGDKVNVIPSEIQVDLDGRLLPGFTPEDMIYEMSGLLGDEVELEVVRFEPGPAEPDMGLFELLGDVLMEVDPEGIPLPLMLTAVTDARFFSKLGIQTYGFTPMQLPEIINFSNVVHGSNERIPVNAVSFGTNAIFKVLQRFHG
jgi:acetylornithine deacetylase/succinyl-diaminopimelate desuccinylase-like protein